MTKDINYYQYTCIDEASRERYLYWYEEHSAEYTVDFVKRCIRILWVQNRRNTDR